MVLNEEPVRSASIGAFSQDSAYQLGQVVNLSIPDGQSSTFAVWVLRKGPLNIIASQAGPPEGVINNTAPQSAVMAPRGNAMPNRHT